MRTVAPSLGGISLSLSEGFVFAAIGSLLFRMKHGEGFAIVQNLPRRVKRIGAFLKPPAGHEGALPLELPVVYDCPRRSNDTADFQGCRIDDQRATGPILEITIIVLGE